MQAINSEISFSLLTPELIGVIFDKLVEHQDTPPMLRLCATCTSFQQMQNECLLKRIVHWKFKLEYSTVMVERDAYITFLPEARDAYITFLPEEYEQNVNRLFLPLLKDTPNIDCLLGYISNILQKNKKNKLATAFTTLEILKAAGRSTTIPCIEKLLPLLSSDDGNTLNQTCYHLTGIIQNILPSEINTTTFNAINAILKQLIEKLKNGAYRTIIELIIFHTFTNGKSFKLENFSEALRKLKQNPNFNFDSLNNHFLRLLYLKYDDKEFYKSIIPEFNTHVTRGLYHYLTNPRSYDPQRGIDVIHNIIQTIIDSEHSTDSECYELITKLPLNEVDKDFPPYKDYIANGKKWKKPISASIVQWIIAYILLYLAISLVPNSFQSSQSSLVC